MYFPPSSPDNSSDDDTAPSALGHLFIKYEKVLNTSTPNSLTYINFPWRDFNGVHLADRDRQRQTQREKGEGWGRDYFWKGLFV